MRLRRVGAISHDEPAAANRTAPRRRLRVLGLLGSVLSLVGLGRVDLGVLDRRRNLGVLGGTLGGGLRLTRSLLRNRQRLDQLDDSHGRVVATAVTDLGDAGVATRTVLVARADL